MREADSCNIPRLVIGGTGSGCGKTTLLVGITGALQRRGLKVATFKCGPDYLDPTYHTRVTGRPSHNLDGWMMGRGAVLSTFVRESAGFDIALCEGVMGLFDGASANDEAGSTAQIAKWLAAPVLLVVNASGMARTLGAYAEGFTNFDPDLRLAALVCNQVGSRGHLALLKEAVPNIPVVGGLPKNPAYAFPERHLGLRTAEREAIGEEFFEAWIDLVEEWFDLDELLTIAATAEPLLPPLPTSFAPPKKSTCRIGIAKDEAFHFYYPDNLTRLEQCGATLVPFSPLHDAELPEVEGLYLGGGYPEIHAKKLAANKSLLAAIRDFAKVGGVIYAECAGMMYLTRTIRTLAGESYEMVGLIAAECQMRDKLQALGYVEVEVQEACILGGAGVRFRGHQFRYSELIEMPTEPTATNANAKIETADAATQGTVPIFRVRKRRGGETVNAGFSRGNVVASYIHAHWASNPKVPANFVATCEEFSRNHAT